MSEELETVVLPEELLHLLREVKRRGGLNHVKLDRRFGGGWAATWGNLMLLSPDTYGPERRPWRLIEYHPPRKPISETVVEVGP